MATADDSSSHFARKPPEGGNPISDADLEGKFRMCAEGAIEKAAQDKLLDAVAGLDKIANAATLAELMVYEAKGGH